MPAVNSPTDPGIGFKGLDLPGFTLNILPNKHKHPKGQGEEGREGFRAAPRDGLCCVEVEGDSEEPPGAPAVPPSWVTWGIN